MTFTCLVCEQSFKWQRQVAEESFPKICPKCNRHREHIKLNLNYMRKRLLELRDIECGEEISKKLKKELDKKLHLKETVPSYGWW